MPASEEYWRNAADAQRMADNSRVAKHKAAWLRIADQWMGMLKGVERAETPQAEADPKPFVRQPPSYPQRHPHCVANRSDATERHSYIRSGTHVAGGVVFGPAYYSARASELEALATHATNPKIRASYRELANGFREMANLASLARNAKGTESARLAKRLVGKSSGTH